MPIRVTCPNCAKSFNTPDANAGRRARCSGCGTIVLIPSQAEETYDISEVEAEEAPIQPPPRAASVPPPSPPTVSIDADNSRESAASSARKAEARSLAAAPPEPWYYRYLTIYAWVVGGVGVAQFIVALIMAILGLVMTSSAPASPFERMGGGAPGFGSLLFAALVAVFTSFVFLLVSFLVAAGVMLGVDAARNLRAIRYQGA